MGESKPKSFEISKRAVWEAWRRVKANKGAAGVDGESIEEFERDLKGNLYKLWNRLSSGSYFPPPVRAVEIPKKDGSSRTLGVPTVADRIAQTVVCGHLEPEVEPVFHPDSYGYRPGRSALDAVGVCRERCWRQDWVLDLDIRAFFDRVPWDLVLKAVAHHTDLRWVLLYVERWLKAPLQREDGSLVERDRGTPQGSSISPLLANVFLHYAFDAWIVREYPAVRFERYCDDVIVHASSERQALQLRAAIARRLAECGLELSEHKTRIVYCKDATRRGSHEHERFTFLGYTFRPRLARSKRGGEFVNFLPAIGDDERKRIGRVIRRWRLHRRSGSTLTDMATAINAEVQVPGDPIAFTSVDYRPLPSHSALGLSAFYVALLALIFGFLAATIVNVTVDAATGYATSEVGPKWRQLAPLPINRWQTLLTKWAMALPITGLLMGIMLIVAIGLLGMDAPNAGYLWLFTWLCAASVAAGTLVLLAILGTQGQLLALLLFVYLGLASAGGTVPVQALPGALKLVSQIEPLRQILSGTRSILYFNSAGDAGLTRGIITATAGLIFWLALGAVVVRWYDRKGLQRLSPDLIDYVQRSITAYRAQAPPQPQPVEKGARARDEKRTRGESS